MNRFFGKVGYGQTIEEPPNSGVSKQAITEVDYFGEVKKISRRLQSGEKVNDDISVGNSIEIVADEYANQHFFLIVYVEWSGVLWKVTNAVVQSPRIVLTLGDVYNGPTPRTSS